MGKIYIDPEVHATIPPAEIYRDTKIDGQTAAESIDDQLGFGALELSDLVIEFYSQPPQEQ